jgi:ABC-2 type transport system permease protein
MGFGLGPIFERAGGGDYINFLAPGVMGQAVLFMAIFSGVELIWDRQFGFLKETLVAPVSRLEIVLGRILGGATIATIQGIIVFILTLFLGFRPRDITLLPLGLLVMFLVALFYSGLGTAIASLMKDFHGFQLIMNFLVMPTFFFSGAIFPLENAPQILQSMSKINPLTYGVDGLREVLTGTTHLGIFQDVFILAFLSLLILGISSRLFSKIEA